MDSGLSKDVDSPTVTEIEQQPIKQNLNGPSLHDPVVDTFPEGGVRGWLTVAGAFCVMFVASGFVRIQVQNTRSATLTSCLDIWVWGVSREYLPAASFSSILCAVTKLLRVTTLSHF